MASPPLPPGPVGYGPGYYRWDPLAGMWRNDWDPTRPWDLMGENEGDQRGNPLYDPQHALGASADAGYRELSERARAASPHTNSALALEFARSHPDQLGGRFDSNPDILKLALAAGWQPPAGWQAPGAGTPAGASGTAPTVAPYGGGVGGFDYPAPPPAPMQTVAGIINTTPGRPVTGLAARVLQKKKQPWQQSKWTVA